jgi:O-antigen/teichoic acid export membrane protein
MWMREQDPEFARLRLPTIVRGAGTLFAGRITSRFLGYALSILAAKTIGLTAFGLYTLGLTILRAVAIDLPAGQSSPVVRYVSIYHSTQDWARVKGTIRFALRSAGLISVATLTAFVLLAEYLAVRIFHQPQLAGIISVLAISIPFFRLSSVFLGATVGMQIMTYRTVTRDVLEPVAMLVAFVSLLSLGLRLEALVWAHLSSTILGCLAAYYFFSRTFTHLFPNPLFSNRVARRVEPITEVRTIWRFTIPLIIGQVFTKLRRWGDILLLGLFMPASQVGLYTILYKTVNALNEISGSIIGVFNPMIGPSVEKGALSTVARQLGILSKWAFSISIPAVLYAMFHAKPILAVLGGQFVGGELAFIILLIGFSFEMTTAPTAQVLTMSGRSHITLANTIGVGVLNLALFLILIPRYGIEGASVAVAVSMLVLASARMIQVRAVLGAHAVTLGYLKPLAAACVSLVITLAIDRVLPIHRFLFIACSFAMFSASYLAVLVLMGLDPADRFVLAKVRERLLPVRERS